MSFLIDKQSYVYIHCAQQKQKRGPPIKTLLHSATTGQKITQDAFKLPPDPYGLTTQEKQNGM